MKITGQMVYGAEIHALSTPDAKSWKFMNNLERFKYEIMAAHLNQQMGSVAQSDSYEHAFYAPLEDLDTKG